MVQIEAFPTLSVAFCVISHVAGWMSSLPHQQMNHVYRNINILSLESSNMGMVKRTMFKMSDQVVEDFSETNLESQVKDAVVNGPLRQEVDLLRSKNMDWFVNTGIILLVGIAVLSKVALIDDGITRGWTASEVVYRIPLDNWLTYNEVLNLEPVYTKAVTSATVYTIGDVISQRTEGKGIGEIDRWRVTRSMLAGLIAHGPLSHLWYNASEDLFENILQWTAWWAFFPKVILDQTTWGPFWNTTYILLLGLMKRESIQAIWSDVKRTTIPLLVSGLKLWPLAHCITYGLIPVEKRLLWVDLVEIIWVVIISSQAAGNSNSDSHGSAVEETTLYDKDMGRPSI